VRHLLDRVEEWLHEPEELTECCALAETLLVPFDRVPLDPDDVSVWVFDAAGDLVPQAMLVGREDGTGATVCVLELGCLLGRDHVTDVLDDHAVILDADFDLIDRRTLDCHIQEFIYRPTLHL
jgi:hypothetical protein